MGRRLAALTAIVLLVVTSACGAGNRNRNRSADPVGIGEVAADGQFEFVVTGFSCGETKVVNGVFMSEAKGVFCELAVRVENTGEAGRTFLTGAQRLIDDEGRKLQPSGEATLVRSPGSVNEDLNPGTSFETIVVFDVADADAVASAELHDSALSRGVVVDLTN